MIRREELLDLMREQVEAAAAIDAALDDAIEPALRCIEEARRRFDELARPAGMRLGTTQDVKLRSLHTVQAAIVQRLRHLVHDPGDLAAPSSIDASEPLEAAARADLEATSEAIDYHIRRFA